MWTKLFVLMLFVTTIQCQDYDALVKTAITEIETKQSLLVTTLNSEIPALQSAQSALLSLSTSLPNSIVNDKLVIPFTTLEAVSLAYAGTNEAYCFQNLATTKMNILQQVRQVFTTCTSTDTIRTTQLISTTPSNIASLNSLAYTAKYKVTACGTNLLYRVSKALFDYCIATATADFNAKASALDAAVTTIKEQKVSITNKIASCIENAVNRGETITNGFIANVQTCISTSNLTVGSIITSINVTASDYLTNQITTVTTSTAFTLNQTVTDTLQSISDAETAVTAANSAKAATFASIKLTLETNSSSVKTAFDTAANTYANSRLASTCVYNIRNALTNNINRQALQYVSCVNAIRSGTLSYELSQIKSLFSQRQAKQSLTIIQCLTQVDNLFVDQGITNCKEDAEGDDITNYLYLLYRSSTLKEEATMVSDAAGNCLKLAYRYVERQISKDKLTFETCVLRTTRTPYTIPYL